MLLIKAKIENERRKVKPLEINAAILKALFAIRVSIHARLISFQIITVRRWYVSVTLHTWYVSVTLHTWYVSVALHTWYLSVTLHTWYVSVPLHTW